MNFLLPEEAISKCQKKTFHRNKKLFNNHELDVRWYGQCRLKNDYY